MARHQIAAEFVGQAHDLAEAQGVEGEQAAWRPRGAGSMRKLAVEFAAEFAPQLDEGAERIAWPAAAARA